MRAQVPTRRSLPTVLLMLLCTVALGAQAAAPAERFRVGNLGAAPGSLVSGALEVPPLNGDAGTEIPITIAHGSMPGPTLALIAGTHGYEYPGITALQTLRLQLDPRRLSGTVIMVHIANLPSFLGRTIYTSPADGKNLNRVYPGDPSGTVSERIAHIITTEVIEQADYLVDLHAGDGNEALRPYVYMPVIGDPEFDAAAEGLARAFGLDTIVIDRVQVSDPDASELTDMTAWSRGIPAITTETGQLGSNDGRYVDMAVRGLRNVMRHLQMVSGRAEPNEGIVWLEDYQVLRSPATGIFRARVRDGYSVAEGTVLGVLVDYYGDAVIEIRAPFAGVVNYVLGTPPVSEGEPVAMISRLSDGPP